MKVHVILTFHPCRDFCELQEIFELRIFVQKEDVCAIRFFDDHVFDLIMRRIVSAGRDPANLWKISAASQWDVYRRVTGGRSLGELDYDSKWVFDFGWSTMNDWEKSLAIRYGFGKKHNYGDY